MRNDCYHRAVNEPAGNLASRTRRKSPKGSTERTHRVAVLTLVFTDIVGSTKLKHEFGDQDAVSAIRRHHAVIREILSRFSQGRRSKPRGFFFIVFTLSPRFAPTRHRSP
jgi:class 3 adenylate cyclase